MAIISRFDISLCDVALFDDATLSPAPYVCADPIQFNGYGLQNSNIITTKIHYSAPSRDLGKSSYPRAHGEFIQTDYFREQVITLEGTIMTANHDALESIMDTLRQNLSVPNGILLLPFNATTRRFEAYCEFSSIFDQRDYYWIQNMPWVATFVVPDPFGRAVSRTTLSPPTVFDYSPTTYAPVNAGTASTYCIWVFTVTAGTASVMTLTNTLTSESLSVTASFVAGDTLTIDGESKIVTKNGVPVDYTGVFPLLLSGTNLHTLAVTGVGYSIIVGEQHYAKFL